MADPNLKDRERGTEAQQEFRNAGNANVVRQAGEGLEAARSGAPVPAGRLTSAEVQAEAGRSPTEGNAERQRTGAGLDESQRKAEEREAIRRQGRGETDSDLQQATRPEGSTALEDPVITSNPD
jgi:hypothetical protein